MGYVIALAGKGGTGKTTIAALIVRALKGNKAGPVLAIDADPNSNLAEALGLQTGESLGQILDEIASSPDKIPPGMPKERYIEYRLQAAVQEAQGFDVLSMGRPEGPGCYCYVNNVLRGMMKNLVRDYEYVVIDNEAGLEHLSRRMSRYADALLVVSDVSSVGLRSAERISRLCRDLNIEAKKRYLLLNRWQERAKWEEVKNEGLEYLGRVAFDAQINELSISGGSIMQLGDNSRALKMVRQLGEKIWGRN